MKKIPESELYEPTRTFLQAKFRNSFRNCHLEITASGKFEEALKKAVLHNIVFSFLKGGGSPDLAGFIVDEYGPKDFITVEIKSEKITIKDIGQAKLYGDLFNAKYAFLISPQPIPEEIKRLHQELFILNRFTQYYKLYIAQLELSDLVMVATSRQGVKEGKGWLEPQGVEEDWFPESPFPIAAKSFLELA